jgi:release factor glutamine methyltransferase
MAVNSGKELDEDALCRYREYVGRRSLGEPVAYITGVREFMSLDFTVRPGVLIPRPETEHSVEYVIDMCRDKEADILDMCTGSGAIAVSLAHYLPRCRVIGADISDIALETSAENARRNGVADRVSIIRADALQKYDFGKKFDVVVSNPPYIPDDVVPGLDKDVADYEPHLALCGGEDGLDFYRAIAKNALDILKDGGSIVFEVGHDQADSVRDILHDGYGRIEYIKDLAGINRVVTAVKE